MSEKKENKQSYHYKLGRMIKKVKAETKWRDIYKIVAAAQKRIKWLIKECLKKSRKENNMIKLIDKLLLHYFSMCFSYCME